MNNVIDGGKIISNIYKPQGSVANKNGRDLEDIIEIMLIQLNYEKLTPSNKANLQYHSRNIPLSAFGDRWFSTQTIIGESIYNTAMKIDFVLYDKVKAPDGIIIEAKWQSSKGSVDEKYVYTALSLLKQKGRKILVLDGGGYKKGAIEYLQKLKGIEVFSLSELMLMSKKEL